MVNITPIIQYQQEIKFYIAIIANMRNCLNLVGLNFSLTEDKLELQIDVMLKLCSIFPTQLFIYCLLMPGQYQATELCPPVIWPQQE